MFPMHTMYLVFMITQILQGCSMSTDFIHACVQMMYRWRVSMAIPMPCLRNVRTAIPTSCCILTNFNICTKGNQVPILQRSMISDPTSNSCVKLRVYSWLARDANANGGYSWQAWLHGTQWYISTHVPTSGKLCSSTFVMCRQPMNLRSH